jgi:chromosome segregation ATPase
MLKMFEKLINEHGSSTILKERLELFSDKYSMLEEKLSVSEQRNAIIESENKKLESKLQQATQEIENLRQIIESSRKDSGQDKINDVEKQILKLFFETNREISAAQIAGQFRINIGNAEYHINNLQTLGLLDASYNMMEDTHYYISPEGRAYLIERT